MRPRGRRGADGRERAAALGNSRGLQELARAKCQESPRSPSTPRSTRISKSTASPLRSSCAARANAISPAAAGPTSPASSSGWAARRSASTFPAGRPGPRSKRCSKGSASSTGLCRSRATRASAATSSSSRAARSSASSRRAPRSRKRNGRPASTPSAKRRAAISSPAARTRQFLCPHRRNRGRAGHADGAR